jgi:hypothetical protein
VSDWPSRQVPDEVQQPLQLLGPQFATVWHTPLDGLQICPFAEQFLHGCALTPHWVFVSPERHTPDSQQPWQVVESQVEVVVHVPPGGGLFGWQTWPGPAQDWHAWPYEPHSAAEVPGLQTGG